MNIEYIQNFLPPQNQLVPPWPTGSHPYFPNTTLWYYHAAGKGVKNFKKLNVKSIWGPNHLVHMRARVKINMETRGCWRYWHAVAQPLWKHIMTSCQSNIQLPCITSKSSIGTYPRELKTDVHTKIYPQMFKVALFIIAKKWKYS